MAEYKGIKGFKVQSVASDPSPAITGRIWYNTASGALKFDGVGTGAWASSDNVPTGRQRSMGFGSTTAALFITGQEQPGIPDGSMVASTLSYNGSAWTDTSNDFNTVRRGGAGFGASSTSGLIAGGVGPPPATAFTEVYNGSTWTEVNNLDEGVSGCASGGTATAGLCVSGEGNPGGNQDWDGTINWFSKELLRRQFKSLYLARTIDGQYPDLGDSGGPPNLSNLFQLGNPLDYLVIPAVRIPWWQKRRMKTKIYDANGQECADPIKDLQ